MRYPFCAKRGKIVDRWPSSSSFRISDVDPDRIGDVASGTSIRVNRLSPVGMASCIRQFQSPDRWALDVTELNCHLKADGALDPGFVVVMFVERACESTICGVPLEDGMVVALPAGSGLDVVVKPGFAYSGAVMLANHWAEIQASGTGVVDPKPDRPIVVRLDPGHAQVIGRLLTRTVAELGATPLAGSSGWEPLDVYDEYLTSIAIACGASDRRLDAADKGVSNRRRQARMAQEFICAHIDETIPATRICRALGISRRQLEYAVRTTFGVGPHELVSLLRLNSARRELMRARVEHLSVTDVALGCGFNHLSRFAASYRALFGEFPSETLRRRG